MAVLIERCSGMRYQDYIDQRILGPLGLDNFYLGLPIEKNSRVADVLLVGAELSSEDRAALGINTPSIDAKELESFNKEELREIGIPGAGGIASAADLAMLYQAMLADEDPTHRAAPGIWQSQTLRNAWQSHTGGLLDPMTQMLAARGLGVIVAGDGEDKIFRGLPSSCSSRTFGNMGTGGQVSWADPESGLSFVFLTNGVDRNALKQGAQSLELSSLAAEILVS